MNGTTHLVDQLRHHLEAEGLALDRDFGILDLAIHLIDADVDRRDPLKIGELIG